MFEKLYVIHLRPNLSPPDPADLKSHASYIYLRLLKSNLYARHSAHELS